MDKFYGKIGFSSTKETSPGIWTEEIVDKEYYGDILRNSRRWQSSENLNDNIIISNEISIIADPFAYNNYFSIRYVEFMGKKWKVSNVEISYPRLKLTLGEIYNEDTTTNAGNA